MVGLQSAAKQHPQTFLARLQVSPVQLQVAGPVILGLSPLAEMLKHGMLKIVKKSINTPSHPAEIVDRGCIAV